MGPGPPRDADRTSVHVQVLDPARVTRDGVRDLCATPRRPGRAPRRHERDERPRRRPLPRGGLPGPSRARPPHPAARTTRRRGARRPTGRATTTAVLALDRLAFGADAFDTAALDAAMRATDRRAARGSSGRHPLRAATRSPARPAAAATCSGSPCTPTRAGVGSAPRSSSTACAGLGDAARRDGRRQHEPRERRGTGALRVARIRRPPHRPRRPRARAVTPSARRGRPVTASPRRARASRPSSRCSCHRAASAGTPPDARPAPRPRNRAPHHARGPGPVDAGRRHGRRSASTSRTRRPARR